MDAHKALPLPFSIEKWIQTAFALVCDGFLFLGGPFTVGSRFNENPFSHDFGKGVHAGVDEGDRWIVSRKKQEYDAIFHTLNVRDGKVTGGDSRKASDVCYLF